MKTLLSLLAVMLFSVTVGFGFTADLSKDSETISVVVDNDVGDTVEIEPLFVYLDVEADAPPDQNQSKENSYNKRSHYQSILKDKVPYRRSRDGLICSHDTY